MRVVAHLILCCFLLATLHGPAWAAETTVQTGDAVGMPQTDQTHTVQAGDTLWDLTARYLQNPWYWPKVWSYNPQLSNPHFIYPGQLVRFFPSNEQLPARIEASAAREMPGDENAAAATQEGEETSEIEAPATSDPGQRYSKRSEVTVAGNRPLAYNSNRGMVVQNVQLVTEKELKESGELTHAFDDKKLLSSYDLVYLKWNKKEARPQQGVPLVLYKMIEEVEHPVTGKDVGYLTQITGTAEILEVPEDEKELVTARILKTFEPIERGQYVAPQKGPLLAELSETPNAHKLEGVVLAGGVYSKDLLGQFHYVFVDRGTKDGVQPGNNFVVMRSVDAFMDDDKIPKRVVGRLIVVDAKETASLALVTQSLRDIAPGDKVEMRTN
ncbi:MAG: LysM peptidoglycan-binding domain-containing protein [Deltaproteobacteria bacterium]|nr:LysM peptidoglycan-binding domain-containing protein [Deltaproteobacteria bacterium]